VYEGHRDEVKVTRPKKCVCASQAFVT